ncbi:MAG: DUF5672 family protein [Bacteroidota bacterium]
MSKTTSRICVGIPVYKPLELLHKYEIISIKNTLLKCRSLFDIHLIIPENFDITSYCTFFMHEFKAKEYDPSYFNGIHGYNRLLKSAEFYERLNIYSHLLIVQTDAFIFDTDYTEFLKYSYVCAPWHSHLINRNLTGLYCGNGGYSLRNIHDCLRILQDDVKVFSFNEILRELKRSEFHRKNPQLINLFYGIYYYYYQNSTHTAHNKMPFIYEDVFWSLVVPAVCSDYSVADGQTALKFAFETRPATCFALNQNKLPTGCHGFNKYEPEFWSRFIPFEE